MNKEKIIFLDIDGVLNLMRPERDQFGSLFHEVFVENLRKIIVATGAKLVITSSWRMSGLPTMEDMWFERDLPGEVIARTHTEYELEYANVKPDNIEDGYCRGDEIKYWLDKHPDVSNYVIIDDDNDMLNEQMNNFVQTSDNPDHPDSLDIGYGLTEICANKAIEILNK